MIWKDVLEPASSLSFSLTHLSTVRFGEIIPPRENTYHDTKAQDEKCFFFQLFRIAGAETISILCNAVKSRV